MLLVGVIHLAVLKTAIGGTLNTFFEVTEAVEALYYSVEIDEWKVHNQFDCYIICGALKGCVKVQFSKDFNICTAYAESKSKTGLQRRSGSIVLQKVRNQIPSETTRTSSNRKFNIKKKS